MTTPTEPKTLKFRETRVSSALAFIKKLRPDNPGRRFAVHYYGDTETAVAIDNPEGGWSMIAAAAMTPTSYDDAGEKKTSWVFCALPSIEEKNDWHEVEAPS